MDRDDTVGLTGPAVVEAGMEASSPIRPHPASGYAVRTRLPFL